MVHTSCHRSFITAVAVLLLAAPLAAQSTSQDSTGQAAASVSAQAAVAATDAVANLGPALSPSPASAKFRLGAVESPVAPVPSPSPAPSTRNAAMMIVGGVGLLVGAVVSGRSGTIIMIAGGVVGLIGLWNYLQ